ncbi:MAG: hypothetical protein AB7T63_13320 [Planctomycetota bacterium]
MRRSTIMAASILILGAVGLLVAAQMLLKPYRQDAALGSELQRMLAAEGAVEETSKVIVQGSRRAGPDHLATEGVGVVVDLVPTAQLRTRRGGLESLTRRTVEAVLDRFRERRIDWVELRLRVRGPDQEPLRTLVQAGPTGMILAPRPPLPLSLP